MKKHIIKIIALFCGFINVYSLIAANGSWTQKVDFGGTARTWAVGFSIGSKGYIGTGWYNGTANKDFWEYDTSANTWTQKANFGGTARVGAVGFSIGSKGYIGTGKYISGSWMQAKDFWEYDPAANTWTQKADFGGTARNEAVGFSIGSKGYIGPGINDDVAPYFFKDFWEYDPAANTWTQKADFGGIARRRAVGFSIGSKGYIGTGENNSSYYKDFWEYNPVSNIWTQKVDFGGLGRQFAVGFSVGSKGYIGTGGTNLTFDKDFWEYDTVANTWTQKADFGGTGRIMAVGFSTASKGYLGTGDDGSYTKKDFWEYDATDTTPDQFTFIDQTNAALSTVYPSNSITVSGINTAGPISIVGGTYAINGGSYTSASGTVNNNDTIIVQQTSSGSYSTTTNATLTIGGVSDTFSVTTLAAPAPTVTATSPNGGESWVVGSAHNVTWTSTGTIANVKIEYSTNSGSSYTPVIASTTNNGSYGWTIPNTPAATCLVRVSDATNAAVNDVSNAAFAITAAPSVTVTSPNGGERWAAGSGHSITWTSTGTIANVKIEYSTDSGSSFTPVTASTTNNGSFGWTVPNTPATTCLIRISDASNAAVNDSSNTVFTIINTQSPPGALAAWGYNSYGQINVPAGNIYVAVGGGGESHSVALKSDGSLVAWGDNSVGQCNVPAGNDYIAVSGGWYHNLALKSDGSLVAWGQNDYGQCNVPAGNAYAAVAAGGMHCVALKSDGSLVAWGRNNYGQITVPAGNNYVAVAAGRYHSLALKSDGSLAAWGRNNYGQTAVPAGNNYVAVAAGNVHSLALKSDGSLAAWGDNLEGQSTVPAGNDYAAVAAGYLYSLALKSDGSLVAWGKNDFGQRDVPAGNHYVAIASGYYHGLAIGEASVISGTVTMGGTALPAVVMNGLPGNPATNASGQYTGTVISGWTGTVTPTLAGYTFTPASRSYNNIATNQTGQDYSASVIIPDTLTVTSPNGGENWVGGSSHDITWTSTGTIANIKIEYSTNSGSSYTPVIASTTNNGSYSWTVPNTPATTCLVRLSNASNAAVNDVSNTVFTIGAAPSLMVTSPNGGENWLLNSWHDITWTWTGAIANVKIEYSKDNGATWTTISASRANTGVYSGWSTGTPVYDQTYLSTTCLVRISDASDAAIADVSNAVFTISATAVISGTITDLSGTPIQDIYARAYDLNNVNVHNTWTNASGQYTIAGFGTGSYKILFSTRYPTQNYLSQWYNDKNHFNAADPVAATVGSTTANINARLATGGIISGRVTDEGGAGVSGLSVLAWAENGFLAYWTATTDANGYYQILSFPTGHYALEFGRGSTYPRKYSGNAYGPESAAFVSVSNGAETPNIDMVMERGGVISGTVTEGGANPVAGIHILAYDAASNLYLGSQPGVMTAADGTYSLIVRAGQTKVLFDTTVKPASGLRSQFYSNQSSLDTAGAVAVVKDQTTSNIGAVLAAGGGTLTINVTNTLGQGFPASIYFYDAVYQGRMSSAVATAANGYLQIKGLLPGNYKLKVHDSLGEWGRYDMQWYANAQTFGTATAVNVTEGGNVPVSVVMNGTVPPANTLTVTSPNGGESWVFGSSHNITWTSTGAITNVKIEFSKDNGTAWTTIIASTPNDGSHPWTVPYAASTQCLVRVSDVSNSATFDVSDAVFKILSDSTEPNDDSATAATLPLGTTGNLIYDKNDVDWYKFFVPPAEAGKDLKVNVRVTSPYPDPIPSGWRSDLDFQLFDGALVKQGWATSGSDNETLYLHAVSSGWYYISIAYCSTDYADSSDYARYTVTLETGTSFGLGYINGRVLDGNGQGIEKVLIRLWASPAYDWNTSFPTMTTGPGGVFSLAYNPGTYALLFEGERGGAGMYQLEVNVVTEYYQDKKNLGTADLLSLTSGQTLNLGDVTLDIGAIVSGHVADSLGTALADVSVVSYDTAGNSNSFVYTDPSGNYTLAGVPIGGAKLRFAKSGYALEFYDNKPSFGSGNLLDTHSGVTIPNINAQLSSGGMISGTVKDGVGTGLSVNVRLYSVLDGTFARAGVTSAAGTGIFNFYNVMPGDYKIYFNAAAAGFGPEWWADAGSFATATVITVTEGGSVTGINAQLAAIAPEINLKQGVTNISTGGTYGFGSKIIGTDTDTVFTIENLGTGDLTLSGLPLTIGGGNADQFSVTAQPASPIVPAGSTTFTVRFHPTTIGAKTAQISIANNDGDENPYLLNLTGTGAAVPATITVTSPNGGESWQAGTSHAITWTSTGTIANVKIEYSTNTGSSYATVIASIANSGSYGWTVPISPSANCLVRISDASNAAIGDVSNAMFSIVAVPAGAKVDFNGDGKEDILWRNYGTGENAVWFLGSPTAIEPAAQNIEPPKTNAFGQDPITGNVFWSAADVGSSPFPKTEVVDFDLRGGSNLDPWEALQAKAPVSRASVQTFAGATGNGLKVQSLPMANYAMLDTVLDVNWNLVGTGDFDGDGKVDILWRNNSTGQNVIWLMNGVTRAGYAFLPWVTDTNWRIMGTGDFNGDGKVDILWRSYSTGQNVVWIMNGVTYTDLVYLNTVSDQRTQIVGTGDFNGDGKVDILWRNLWTGQNAIWYLDGTTYTGYDLLNSVADGNWLIMGAGDFNADGKMDIIWRNVLTGQNAIWYLNGATYLGYDLMDPVSSYLWLICNR